MQCTITKHLKIVSAEVADYKALARFHYRSGRLGPLAAIYKIIDTHPVRAAMNPIVGIIIYSMPTASVELRNIATAGVFTKLGKSPAMQLVNNNVRVISRVVIEPRYRGLGLAHRLVSETMGLLEMPYIEALAVMGRVSPFFEKAGMMAFSGTLSSRVVKLKQALEVVGITEDDYVDIELVDRKLSALTGRAKDFIEAHIKSLLGAYGRRGRNMLPGLERSKLLISKLGDRPVYYLWRNTKMKMRI